MISAPYHPIQTKSQLQNWVTFDDDLSIWTIQPSTDPEPRGITQRIAVPQSETRSIRSSMYVMSSVEASNTGYEGMGMDIKCLAKNGSSRTPLLTYHNDPWRAGDPTKLITDKFPTFAMVNFIEQIPYDRNVDFVDFSFGVRGYAGELQIASAMMRNHYVDTFETIVGGATWTDYERQKSTFFDGRVPETYNHYIDAHAVRIAKSQEVSISIEGLIDSAQVFNIGGARVPFMLIMALKMRRVSDGLHDYKGNFILSRNTGEAVTNVVSNEPISRNFTFNAENGYDQIEPMLSIYTYGAPPEDIVSLGVTHSGMRFSVKVGDVTATGS